MATTTNYSWTTPDDTALVKDGAAAIRTLGSSVDTTVKNLNPETTTGAISYRGATANQKVALPIGTAGQVLKVNSGATAPEWASASGGELKEVVFTSSNATWSIPSGVTTFWALCVGSGGGGGASSTATASNSGGGGGAGQVLEKVFTIAGGDTQLNITVPAGGAGGTAGGKGSSGSAATIVGVTSATTYVSAAGGGGGGGGAVANVTGISGASGGGNGIESSNRAGGGGGMNGPASDKLNAVFGAGSVENGGGASATTLGVTGFPGGAAVANAINFGGAGVIAWGRALAGGGPGAMNSATAGITQSFGAGANTTIPSAGSNATANTGAGGGGGKTNATTSLAGGNGGSGLVVLRYVGA
jgi:hypothetical protein